MSNSYATVRRNLRASGYATDSLVRTSSVAVQAADRGHATKAVSLREVEYQLSSGVLAGALEPGEVSDAQSPQERLLAFKEGSGLTWDQVARVFGVSKRSVMNWRSGGRMSAGHEETLAAAQAVLSQAPADVELHDWLMTVDTATGRAPFQVLLALRFGDEVSWIDRQPQLRE